MCIEGVGEGRESPDSGPAPAYLEAEPGGDPGAPASVPMGEHTGGAPDCPV